MTFIEPLLNKGYCVLLDNFYNFPELEDLLITKKTKAYGMLRQNRKYCLQQLKT